MSSKKFSLRGRALVSSLIIGGIALSGLGGTFALAAPSDDDIARAKQAEKAAAGSVADIEVKLAQNTAKSEEALTAAQRAGERFAQASVKADAASRAADKARKDADQAKEKVEEARKSLGDVATTV